jgi:hypothetical protein
MSDVLINHVIGIIKSNAGISFVVSYSGSGITSGDSSCVISVLIGLIGRYINVTLYVVGSAVLS